MSGHPPLPEQDPVEEARAVRAARAARDAALTPAQRLERVHELCRQLATLRPVEPPRR